MSDYIDREKLINDGISKGFCDWYDEIKYAQKVKAIQLDKVKKACEKIKNLETQIQSYNNDDTMISQADVLAILNNLLESEEYNE